MEQDLQNKVFSSSMPIGGHNDEFRETFRNPLESISNFNITNGEGFFPKQTFHSSKDEISYLSDSNECLFNDIHMFEKENSMNLGLMNKYSAYQRKLKEPKLTPNFQTHPLVSEFVMNLEEGVTKSLSESKDLFTFSQSFNDLLNFQVFKRLNNFKDNTEEQKYEFEDFLETKSFKSSVASSINFELTGGFGNLLQSLNQSITKTSISCGSDKENTPPLMKNQIKAHLISNTSSTSISPDNQNIILKCELGVNGLSKEELHSPPPIFSEIPLTLTIHNGLSTNKIFSTDLIVMIMLKDANSKNVLLNKNVAMKIIEFIFSKLRENDRMAVLKLGDKNGARQKVFLQKLATLSKTMKKLLLQFLNFEEFSEQNADFFSGVEAILNELNQRSYRNNNTSILILTDFVFDKNEKINEISEINGKIAKFEKLLTDARLEKDSCLNFNCLYCGNNPTEAFFLESICSRNHNSGFFSNPPKLSILKKSLVLIMRKIKEISLFDVDIFIKIQESQIVKEIRSANYELRKETMETYAVKIPSINLGETKVLFLILTLDGEKIQKTQKVNLLRVQMITNKFLVETSLMDQSLNFEKLVTHPLDICFFPNIAKNLIKCNRQVFRLFYQIKICEFLMNEIHFKENEPKLAEKMLNDFYNKAETIKIREILRKPSQSQNFPKYMDYIFQKICHSLSEKTSLLQKIEVQSFNRKMSFENINFSRFGQRKTRKIINQQTSLLKNIF